MASCAMTEMLKNCASLETPDPTTPSEVSPLNSVMLKIKAEIEDLQALWEEATDRGQGNFYGLSVQISEKRKDLETLQTVLRLKA